MRKPVDSLILASPDWAVFNLAFFTNKGRLGFRWADQVITASLPVCVALTLLTIAFAVRDFKKNKGRLQVLAALALIAPFVYHLFLHRW
jgi:hypothetical protein